MSLAPYVDADRRQSRDNLLQLMMALGLSLSVVILILRRRLLHPLEALAVATGRIANASRGRSGRRRRIRMTAEKRRHHRGCSRLSHDSAVHRHTARSDMAFVG